MHDYLNDKQKLGSQGENIWKKWSWSQHANDEVVHELLERSDVSRMIERFQRDDGRALRFEAFLAQTIVSRDPALAEELAELVELAECDAGQTLIEQNGEDDDIFFIISGSFGIHVNGRRIGSRGRGDHVGEMAAVEPTQRRSATVVAEESSLVAKLSAQQFAQLGKKYPDMYRQIARSLSRRLLERNKHVGAFREKVRLFIISSAEALPVARLVANSFEHDPFITTIWTDGVFKVANYTLQDLEAQVDDSDFAVAIAHADDLTESRGKDWPSPRDNVVFELGLFMGKLGRQRAVLMEPREEKVKLPSDLSGVTAIPYRFEKGRDAAALMAPACDKLRNHILVLGPFNG